MQFILDSFVTAFTWVWNTGGWWLVTGLACVAVVAGVVEWRRR